MKDNKQLSLQAYKYYFTSEDLFDDFKLSTLDVNRKLFHRRYGKYTTVKSICCRIFIYFLYLVILDIIKNNVKFVFPITKLMVIGITIIKGNELIELLKNSKNQMYDYFGSEFKFPKINIFFKKKNIGMYSRDLVLNYSLTRMFFDNVNKGNIYG